MAFAAPEAAGASASLLYMAIALVAFLGYIVARGLIATWTHSIGYLLNWLGQNLDFSFSKFGVHVPLDLGAPFLEVDRLVLTALQNWAEGLEAETAYFWHGSATIAQWTADQVAGLADDTADAFDWMTHIHLPRLSAGKVSTAALTALVTKLIAAQLPKVWNTVTHVVHVVEHTVTHTVTKVVQAAGAIPLPNPWAFPRFHRWWHDLTKWREVTQRRLHRLEALLGVTGMAIALANVLGLPSWRCLTKGNIGKTARHLCGLSPAFLNDLLALVTDALVLTNICTLIGLMEDGFSLIEPELLAFVTGLEAVACYGSAGTLPALPGPAPFLTPNPGVTLYLA